MRYELPDTVRRNQQRMMQTANFVKNTFPFTAEHRLTFDTAARKIYYAFGSWPALALCLEIHTGVWTCPATLERYLLDRTLPLAYACWLVDLMRGDITLLDLYPQLAGYVHPVSEQSK